MERIKSQDWRCVTNDWFCFAEDMAVLWRDLCEFPTELVVRTQVGRFALCLRSTPEHGALAQKLVRRVVRYESMRSGTHVHALSSFIWRQPSFALVGQVGKQLHRASLPAATSTRVPGHTHSVSAAAAPSLILEGGAGVLWPNPNVVAQDDPHPPRGVRFWLHSHSHCHVAHHTHRFTTPPVWPALTTFLAPAGS